MIVIAAITAAEDGLKDGGSAWVRLRPTLCRLKPCVTGIFQYGIAELAGRGQACTMRQDQRAPV